MYPVLKHIHSGLRWLVLLALLLAIYDAWVKWKAGTSFSRENRLASFLAFNLINLQVLVGGIIYFVTPRIVMSSALMKDKVMRFFAVEHALMMLVAVALINIGYSKTKKAGSFKSVFWYYLIALLIILLSIPWPFQQYATGWF